MNRPAKSIRLQPLLILAGLLLVSSFAFFPLSQGSIVADLPEVAIPLGVSLGIALYSVWLLQSNYDVARVKRIAMCGWIGAIVASVGIWVLSQQLHRELSVPLLLDEGLTVLSVGSGIGIVLGTYIVHAYRSEDNPERNRVLAETVWTNEPQPNPIFKAVTTQIAELEGVDPLELEQLYEHINPDVFTGLQTQDDAQWQLVFYTNDYEIRVSSQGTVTIYNADHPGEGDDIVRTSHSNW